MRVALALTGDDPPVVNRSPNRWTGTAAHAAAAQAGRHRALVVRAAAHPRAHGCVLRRRGGAERSRRQRRRSSAAVQSSAVQSSSVAGSTLNLERARLHRLEKRLEGALVDPARTLATGVPSWVTSSLASKLLEH